MDLAPLLQQSSDPYRSAGKMIVVRNPDMAVSVGVSALNPGSQGESCPNHLILTIINHQLAFLIGIISDPSCAIPLFSP